MHVSGDPSSFSNYYSKFSWIYDRFPRRDDRYDVGVKETRKHRANTAYVIAVCESKINQKFEIGLKDIPGGYSIRDYRFEYVSDSWVSVSNYYIYGDTSCAYGIHYFPGWKAAIKYYSRANYHIVRQYPYFSSKFELVENALSTILPSWMEHKISKFKCIHDDIYEHSYDCGGKTIFDMLTMSDEVVYIRNEDL